jgi:hypothetical protein
MPLPWSDLDAVLDKPGGFAETMGKYHKMEPQAAVEHEMKLRQLRYSDWHA